MRRRDDPDRTAALAHVLAVAGPAGILLFVANGVLGVATVREALLLVPLASLALGVVMRTAASGVSVLLLRCIGAAPSCEAGTAGWSEVDALVARGRIHEAAAAYRRALARAPQDSQVHMRLADLYAGPLADPRRAATHYEACRRTAPTVRGAPSDRERYALQRLVDLYDGPLAEPARALACLEALAERFPHLPDGTAAASLVAERRRRAA